MNTILTLAWRNLWRHKKRTWITIGAMIFSNILLVFMISLQFGTYDTMIENSLRAFSGQIQIARNGYDKEPKMRSTLPHIVETADTIRQLHPDFTVSARAQTFVLASSEERSLGIAVTGVEPAYEQNISSIPGLIKTGRYLNEGASGEIVIGDILAKNLKVNVGDEITAIGSGFDGSFAANVWQIVGIFKTSIAEIDRNVSQINLIEFQQTFSMGDKGHNIILNGPILKNVFLYQQQISADIADIKDIEVLNWEELNPALKQSIEADFASSWFMYAVLIALVSFSVLNTQLMSVLERTREFGIMMAIGFNTWRLTRLVFIETALLSALGLLLGAGAGFLLALYLSIAGLGIPGMEEMAAQYNLDPRMYPDISLLSILLGPSIVFIGSMLAAIYPAMRLHFLQPVAAMRSA